MLARAQTRVKQGSRIGDERLQPSRDVHVLLDDPLAVQRKPVVHLREDQVLLAKDDVELRPEDLLVRSCTRMPIRAALSP